jgi:YbbR domain-containing protein
MKKKQSFIVLSFLFLSLILWSAVTFSGEFVINIRLPLQVSSTNIDLSIDEEIPSEVRLKIKSSGWNLLRTRLDKSKKVIIDLNQYQNNSIIQLSKFNVEQFDLPPNIEILDVKPETIFLTLKKSFDKKIKVVPNLKLTFKKDHAIVSPISVVPSEITIRGSINNLSKIDSIYTEEIIYDNLSENFEITTTLQDTLTNTIIYEKVPIKVNFRVEQIADKEFEAIPLGLNNPSDGRYVVVIPNMIDVKLRGGIKILTELTNDSIKAFVDLSNVNLDSTITIKPSVIVPLGTELVETSPTHVNLIIRK